MASDSPTLFFGIWNVFVIKKGKNQIMIMFEILEIIKPDINRKTLES